MSRGDACRYAGLRAFPAAPRIGRRAEVAMRTCVAWAVACVLTVCVLMAGAARADRQTLAVDLAADAATLDPQVQWDTDSYSVYRNIFDNLLTRDANGKIVPQVATAWHYAGDTTVVFDLRDDIRFQDGTRLTPQDVVFSIRRITDPAFKSPQLSQFDRIVSAEVSGPAQVTLRTKSPYPVLLAQLVKLSIVPEAAVRKLGDNGFNEHPLGSGPYRLRDWTRGVAVTLDAVPDYWRGRPPFPAVQFRPVTDVSTRVADLRAGRADIVRGLGPDQAVALKGEARIRVLSVPTERVAYLFVNAQAGPTRDVRVRRAIAMAVDRDTLIGALQEGFAKPVNVVLAPPSFGYDDTIKPWPFDPDAARRLVKEAGAEGAAVTFLTSPAYDRRLNEAVQQMLGEIGLNVNIVQVDQPTYLRRRQGTPEEAGALSQGRWSCACQDADGTIWPLFHTGSIWSKYSNPAFDAAVDAARATLDEAQRRADYHAAFQILRDDVPGIGLFQDFAIYGARREISWTPTPNEAFFAYDMKWTE
jgi:peptide/nickel transport system substrate-binding protein